MKSISAINLAFLEDLGSSEYNPSISDKRTNTSASTNCDILAANWSLSPYLISKVATVSFSLIMGEDNLRNFHKWKNYENILSNHTIYVYPRVLTPQEEDEYKSLNTDEIDKLRANKNIIYCQDAPVMRISASFIRKSIKENNDVRFLLSEPVHKYVEEMHFYK